MTAANVPTTASASEAPAATVEAVEPVEAMLPQIVDWLPDAARPVWDALITYPALAALVVAVSFYAVAWVARAMLVVAARSALSTRSQIDDVLINGLRGPVFTTILYFGLTLAVRTAALPFGTEFFVHALLSVIVASWMRTGFRLSSTLLDGLARVQHRFRMVEERTVPLVDLTMKLLVILFGSYALLLIWGINPVGWLASAGIVGIAVGFAAKDTLANLFSGFFIVADAPYKLGDYINLDSGERGRVTAIGMRSTRVMTRDDVEVTIPNAVIANAKIVNESGGPNRKIRVAVPVGAAYGSDVDRVCEVLQGVAVRQDGVCDDPEPRVRMRGFGASSLDFELLIWIDEPENRGMVRHHVLMGVYKAFASAEIEIPYSKHDIFIKEMPP